MPPAYATSHAAPVPLAEICGGLLAASPVLGAQSWGPGTVPAAGGKRGQRSLGEFGRGEGPWGGEQLIRFLTCPPSCQSILLLPQNEWRPEIGCLCPRKAGFHPALLPDCEGAD